MKSLLSTILFVFFLFPISIWTDTVSTPLLAVSPGYSIGGAAFSPDDSSFVTVGLSGVVLWNTATGSQIRTYSGHTSNVNAADFSPDGSLLATCSNDLTVKVWNVATGNIVRDFSGFFSAPVYRVDISPDGNRVVASAADGTIHVFNIDTGLKSASLVGHTGANNTVDFSSDGSKIFTASNDGMAGTWNAATGILNTSFTIHKDPNVNWSDFSEDDTRLVTVTDISDKKIRVYDVATGSLLLTIDGHSHSINQGLFSPDGSRILTTSNDGTSKLWNAFTGEELRTFLHGKHGVAYSYNGSKVITVKGDSGSSAKVWDITDIPLLTVTPGYTALNLPVVSPDGSAFLTLAVQSHFVAEKWDISTGSKLLTFSGHTNNVNAADFSPDGSKLVTSSNDKTVKIWNASTGALLSTISDAFSQPIYKVDWSSDGSKILAADGSAKVVVFDANTGSQLFSLTEHSGGISVAKFSSDGSRIFTAAHDGTARTWNAADGILNSSFTFSPAQTNSGDVSPDGKRLVTVTDNFDQRVRVYDMTTGDLLLTFNNGNPVHSHSINQGVFSPNGTMILTSSNDGTSKLWNAFTGEELRTFAHGQAGGAFTPDSQKVVTTTYTTAYVWNIADIASLFTFIPTSVIDPNVDSETKITAFDAATGAFIHESAQPVSIDGDTAVVGVPGDDVAGSNSGSVYVFVKSGNVWIIQAILVANDAATGDAFGAAVAISGNTIVVGANFDDDGGDDSGSAYVFVRSGSSWSQQAKLTASNPTAEDQFGHHLTILEDTIVIGTTHDDDGGTQSGAAYVFVRSGSTWSLESKLVASDAAAGDIFGNSVEISGDTIVVGAFGNDDGGNSSGSAYVFVRSGSSWNQQAKLTASDPSANAWFGINVTINGDTVLIGASGDDDGGSDTGSVYVFERSGSSWIQQTKLKASDATTGDQFGESVSISGNTVVVGAHKDDDGGTNSGSAYIFIRSGSNWSQQAKLTASDASSNDHFGFGSSISGTTVIIGTKNEQSTDPVSAYIYELNLPNTIDIPGITPGVKPLNMVLIPAGTFTMGSPIGELDRNPDEVQHQVTISQDFYISEFEITQAQWEAVMGSNPSYFSGNPNHPVEQVSWGDCQAFITALNQLGLGTFRLPTEAEWEYAYRSETTTRFYWGEDTDFSQINNYWN